MSTKPQFSFSFELPMTCVIHIEYPFHGILFLADFPIEPPADRDMLEIEKGIPYLLPVRNMPSHPQCGAYKGVLRKQAPSKRH
jgi:hypothetical protein